MNTTLTQQRAEELAMTAVYKRQRMWSVDEVARLWGTGIQSAGMTLGILRREGMVKRLNPRRVERAVYLVTEKLLDSIDE